MSRHLPPEVRADLQDRGSPHALVAFLTLTHINLPEPIRVVSDPIDYEIDGVLWVGCPFGFRLLTDEDQAPVTQLRVQNVDRRIGEAVREAVGAITARLEVRSTADFDLSEMPRVPLESDPPAIYGFRHFTLVDVEANDLEISGTVMLRDYTQNPWPGISATQSRCPGLFR